MSQSLGGQSSLTSNGALLFYYAMGLLSMVLGFTVLIALIGAFISGRVAKKEGADLVRKHCKWIFRSIWVSYFLTFLVVCAVIGYVIGNAAMYEQIMNLQDYTALWTDPAYEEFLGLMVVALVIASLIVFWFIYRMLRGGFKLLANQAPKG